MISPLGPNRSQAVNKNYDVTQFLPRFNRYRNLKQNEAQSDRAESTHEGVNQGSKDVTQTSFFEDVPLVEFMYLVFTRMPGESYRR